MKQYYLIFLLGFFLNSACLYATKYDYKGDCVCHPDHEDLDECLDKELAEYDKKLNELYKDIRRYDTDNKFKKAEMSWVKFKELDCNDIALKVNEGKEYTYIYKACLINKTKERIEDLKRNTFFFGWIRGKPGFTSFL